VLASRKLEQNEAWRSRLPCHLVQPRTCSSPSYRMYTGMRDIAGVHPSGTWWMCSRTTYHGLIEPNNTITVQNLIDIAQGLFNATLSDSLTIAELQSVVEGMFGVPLHVQYTASEPPSLPHNKTKRKGQEIITIEDTQRL